MNVFESYSSADRRLRNFLTIGRLCIDLWQRIDQTNDSGPSAFGRRNVGNKRKNVPGLHGTKSCALYLLTDQQLPDVKYDHTDHKRHEERRCIDLQARYESRTKPEHKGDDEESH